MDLTKAAATVKANRPPPPPSEAMTGLRAVAQVAKGKNGAAGVAALKSGLAAQTLAESRGPDPSGSLRKHVQAAYDKSMSARQRLASAVPTNPEDTASQKTYGKRPAGMPAGGSGNRLSPIGDAAVSIAKGAKKKLNVVQRGLANIGG